MIKQNMIYLAALLSVVIAVITATANRPQTPKPTPPACAQEDGGPYPCIWDGPSRGSPGGPGYRQGDRVTITADD